MIFDIVVLAVILVSALIAFLRGFIREVLTIFGVMGGLAAAYVAGPLLVPQMENWLGVKEGAEPEKLLGLLPYDLLAKILSYGAVFLVVVIVLSIVSHLLAETARRIGLGPVDRTLGVIFGIARGIILIAGIYLPFHVFMSEEEKEKQFEGSKTYFFIEQTAEAMAGLVPQGTFEKFKQDAGTVQEGNKTREKLKQMDILKGNGAPREEDMPPAEGGYTEEFREQMDQLFENKPAGTPPANNGTPND